jgi:type IV pilus assembly protein PilB
VSDQERIEVSQRWSVPAIELGEFSIEEGIIDMIPSDIACKHRIVPVSRIDSVLILAMADPGNQQAIDEVEALTGLKVERVGTSEPSMSKALDTYYRHKT